MSKQQQHDSQSCWWWVSRSYRHDGFSSFWRWKHLPPFKQKPSHASLQGCVWLSLATVRDKKMSENRRNMINESMTNGKYIWRVSLQKTMNDICGKIKIWLSKCFLVLLLYLTTLFFLTNSNISSDIICKERYWTKFPEYQNIGHSIMTYLYNGFKSYLVHFSEQFAWRQQLVWIYPTRNSTTILDHNSTKMFSGAGTPT